MIEKKRRIRRLEYGEGEGTERQKQEEKEGTGSKSTRGKFINAQRGREEMERIEKEEKT